MIEILTSTCHFRFESEGNELVTIQNLKRIPQNNIQTKTTTEGPADEKETSYNSFFTHLQGCEQNEQLR